jgi:phosphate-selective porin
MKFKGIFMRRISVCLVAVLLVTASLDTVSAQTTTAPAATPAPAATDAKPSKMKLTVEKLKEMRASWKANKPKLTACRKEVKAKGLAGDDRWFYIEDCMNKT